MALKVWTLSRGYHYEGNSVVKIFDTLDKAMLYAESIIEKETDSGEWVRGHYDNTLTWENEICWLAVTLWEVE